MEQVLNWIVNNKLLTSAIILPLVGVIIRMIPKQKLMNLIPEKAWTITAEKFMFGIGVIISKFGNTRIGKKAMDKIEEGIIHTIVACIMSWLKSLYNIATAGLLALGKGLRQDNEQAEK